MISLIGDIHGNFMVLRQIVKELARDYGNSPIIQVGDFGFWPGLREHYVAPEQPVYFIDGNHDDVGALVGTAPFEWEKPVELWPNALYVPRGTVLELDGKTILFLGGAKSLDRGYRRKGIGVNGWFEEEVIRPVDRDRALKNAEGKKIDFMVTHTPPSYVVDKYFGFPIGWGLPADWYDESARYVQEVWEKLDCPALYCGHMHRALEDGTVRILDINEVYTID